MAEAGEKGDGDAADAAGGTGDGDGARARGDARPFERDDAEHRGEAGRADGRRPPCVAALGQRLQPLGRHPRPLREATWVPLADAPAGEHHGLPRREGGRIAALDRAGEVDAGGHRRPPDDRRAPGERKTVLVVEAGIVDPHRDLAVGQVGLGEGPDPGDGLAVLPIDDKGSVAV